jgi:hypothetical protein
LTHLHHSSSPAAKLLESAAVNAINEKLKEVYWYPMKNLSISLSDQTCQMWSAKQRQSIWFLLPAKKECGNSAKFFPESTSRISFKLFMSRKRMQDNMKHTITGYYNAITIYVQIAVVSTPMQLGVAASLSLGFPDIFETICFWRAIFETICFWRAILRNHKDPQLAI